MPYDETKTPQEIIIHEAPTSPQYHEASFGQVERLNKEQQQARKWLQVATALTKDRINEYKKLGNPDANDSDFLGAHKAFLLSAKDRLLEGDPMYTNFLSKLEEEAEEHAITGDLVTTPTLRENHYVFAHIHQLDFLASLVQEGQTRADEGIDPIDLGTHKVDYTATHN